MRAQSTMGMPFARIRERRAALALQRDDGLALDEPFPDYCDREDFAAVPSLDSALALVLLREAGADEPGLMFWID